MQDGVVVKGLAPRRLDPARYHLNSTTDLNELEKGMPWRSIQDEFGKFKWTDNTPESIMEPPSQSNLTLRLGMCLLQAWCRHPCALQCSKTNQTWHVHRTFRTVIKGKKLFTMSRFRTMTSISTRRIAPDKKSNVVIKAKSIPVTPKSVASSQGAMGERWLVSIYKEIENFLQNMAIEDADPSLVVRWKSLGKWPLPCQMVFALKPLTQSQQVGDDVQEEYKHKSRLVICGNFASWGEHSTTTTNLDAPLLRLMVSLACSKEVTWSSIDITSAFLNADIHDDDTVLVTPPPTLVKMDIVKPNTVWHVKKAIYGLREAPRLWQQERDQKLRDLEFEYQDKLAHLVQSYIHPSLWFIAEGPKESTPGIPPFDHCMRSDQWTARLRDHHVLGYVDVYVDGLLVAGPRTRSDSMIRAVQEVWKTSAPEHLGPDQIVYQSYGF